jgi:hypothetical protein
MTRRVTGGLIVAVMLGAAATIGALRRNVVHEDQVGECRGTDVAGQPELPKDLLLQVQVFDAHGRPAGYRIFRDGRYEGRSAESDWTSGAAMTPAQLDAIRSAMQVAQSDRLHDRYEPVSRTGDAEQSTVQLDFALDRGPRRIAVVRPCQVPELDGFVRRMAEIFKQGPR